VNSLLISPYDICTNHCHAVLLEGRDFLPSFLSTAVRVQLPIALVTAPGPISFSQALAASPQLSSHDNLHQPSIRGEAVSIKISSETYEKGIEVCKRNLRGRFVLNKGDKPYTTKDIQLKLQTQ
jgi:hypothetical protein